MMDNSHCSPIVCFSFFWTEENVDERERYDMQQRTSTVEIETGSVARIVHIVIPSHMF